MLVGSTALAQPIPDYPFVFTSGTAEVDIAPDIAHLEFNVIARDPDGAKALAAVQDSSAKVTEILAKAGVKAVDIDASSIDKSEDRHWDDSLDKSVFDGFVVTRQFEVTVRDLAKYPEMGKALLQLPNALNFRPSFNRSDRDQQNAALFERAARDATARAERMAASFGRKLGAVRAISQIPFYGIPYWLGFDGGDRPYALEDLANGPGAPDTLLVPATITMAVDVNVVFELQ